MKIYLLTFIGTLAYAPIAQSMKLSEENIKDVCANRCTNYYINNNVSDANLSDFKILNAIRNEKDAPCYKNIFDAIKADDQKAVAWFLKTGTNINTRRKCGLTKESPLLHAVNSGTDEMVKYLIQAGADINSTNGCNATSLHAAADDFFGENKVKLLLSAGADCNIQELGYGDTPLHIAAYHGDPKIVGLLLNYGADPNIIARNTGRRFETPLQVSLKKKHNEITKLLLHAGADCNIRKNEYIDTALHIAASKGNINMIKLLLDNGADPDAIVTENGMLGPESFTAYNIAEKTLSNGRIGNKEIMNILSAENIQKLKDNKNRLNIEKGRLLNYCTHNALGNNPSSQINIRK